MKSEQVTNEVIIYESLLNYLGLFGQVYSVYFYDSGLRKKSFLGIFREDGRYTPLNLKETVNTELAKKNTVITPVNESRLKRATKPVGIGHFIFPIK